MRYVPQHDFVSNKSYSREDGHFSQQSFELKPKVFNRLQKLVESETNEPMIKSGRNQRLVFLTDNQRDSVADFLNIELTKDTCIVIS